MAASRCVTSALRLTHLHSSNWASAQFQGLLRTSRNLSYLRRPTNAFPSAPRLLCHRYLSQKASETTGETQSQTTPPTGSILGSFQGLGLAGDVLKQQKEAQAQACGSNPSDDQSGEQKSKEEDEEEKRRKEAEASWRAMKYSFYFLGITFSSLGGFLIVTWGAPDKDSEGNVMEDEFSSKPIPLQYILRSWNAVMNYSKMIRDPSRDKLLPDPLKEPYYQAPYTLILEMTGVLVHPDWTYQTGWRFKKRPGIDFFLQTVGPPTFEVVIYTAEQAFTAFPIIDALDPQGYIMYRLFRDATRYVDGHHVKDLDCINRDLSKVIVLDWNSKSVQSHPRNALKIKEWKGNDDDRTLVDLALLLKTIATSEVQDVREVLDFYNQFDDPIEAFRENQRKLQEQQELMEQMNKEASQPPTSVARNLFGRRFY